MQTMPEIVLTLAGAFFTIRQMILLLAAEQGRKKDLVQRLYAANQELFLSVLIPFHDSRQTPKLAELLTALSDQTYQATKVSIYIACTSETQLDVETIPLHPNITVLTHSDPLVEPGRLTEWLIERCLAKSRADLFVFLKPEDIVKPDFFKHVVSKSFDHAILQGYVANRRRPQSLLSRVLTLNMRHTNRVKNAGRFHLGFSPILQDSAWAARREVFEMVPFKQRDRLDNLEYTIRLALQNFKVGWSPNVVVYRDDQWRYAEYISLILGSQLRRIKLILGYGLPLLFKTLLQFKAGILAFGVTLFRVPVFVSAVIILSLLAWNHFQWDAFGLNGIAGSEQSPIGSTPLFVLLGMAFVVHMFSLLVARDKPADYFTSFFLTPFVYANAVLVLPWTIFQGMFNQTLRFRTQKHIERSRLTTRFNESLDPLPNFLNQEKRYKAILDELLTQHPEASEMSNLSDMDSLRLLYPEALGMTNPYAQDEALMGPAAGLRKTSHIPAPTRLDSNTPERLTRVYLSNGSNRVPCLLKTETRKNDKLETVYKMTLGYKSHSFSSSEYRILDQAFYELQAKLGARGLTIMTCGSCGYFHNPMADLAGKVNSCGVCLFGKQGKQIDFDHDAVTVISQACPYHAASDQREGITKAWQASIQENAEDDLFAGNREQVF